MHSEPANNRKQIVYDLSKRYSPPTTDLRKAEIMDSYGDESYATRPIQHLVPEDVTRVDLDHYAHVWAFMQFHDLLFYLYPVVLQYELDNKIECIDFYLYSFDRLINQNLPQLEAYDKDAVIQGLQWIWDAGSTDYADWRQCPNLQRVLGVSVD